MNDLAIIVLGSGVQGGLNPCIFLSGAFFIVLERWVASDVRQRALFRVIFGMIFLLSSFMFIFGPGQVLTLQKNFISIAKGVCFIFSAGSFVLGVLSIKNWFTAYRKPSAGDLQDKKVKLPLLLGSLGVVVMAVVLCLLSTLWPVDYYVLYFGCEEIVKGQWNLALPVLGGYILVSMWPIWFVWALLSIKGLRPSFLRILCAAIFFTASTGVILIFK